MQSGVLEQVRQLHSDIERHQKEIVKQLESQTSHFRQELLRDHFIARKIREMKEKSEILLELYRSNDELEAIKADQSQPIARVLQNFEGAVAKLREYHKKFSLPAVETPLEVPDPDTPPVHFSGEERHGRCLDLHRHYSQYVNFLHATVKYADDGAAAAPPVGPGGRKVDVVEVMSYQTFLAKFSHFNVLPLQRKLCRVDLYAEYMEGLYAYLVDFFDRTRPLTSMDDIVRQTEQDFDAMWAAGRVLGWEGDAVRTNTAAQRVALVEAKAERFVGVLQDVITATQQFVVRKQSRSVEEVERELQQEEEQLRAVYSSSLKTDRTKNKRYADPDNAKKLPLDWDGKPIPVWLYHLHGLHMKHTCDICLGHTYFGPLAFERHFLEPRHLAGLQRLGIDNGRNYVFITKPDEALALSEKLASDQTTKRFRHEDEEMEDPMGNVMTRQTHEEMRKQNIIMPNT